MVEALRTRHYSRRTEEAYLHWIRRFLAFHNGTHPREMAEMDVNRFLTHNRPRRLRFRKEDHDWVKWRSLYFHDPEGNQVELVCYDESLSQ